MFDKIKIIRDGKFNLVYLNLEEDDLNKLISNLADLKFEQKFTYWDDRKNKTKVIFQNKDGYHLKSDNWWRLASDLYRILGIFVLCVLCILGFIYTWILGFSMIISLFKE
jgi:hypothetical protein